MARLFGKTTDTVISDAELDMVAYQDVSQAAASDEIRNISHKNFMRPIVSSETSSATPTIDTDKYDVHRVTALAAAITSMTTNLSGTPTHGQKLIVEILDNGTARAITWGASFRSTDVGTLPTTTTLSKLLRVGLMYDSADSIWECVAVSNEA